MILVEIWPHDKIPSLCTYTTAISQTSDPSTIIIILIADLPFFYFIAAWRAAEEEQAELLHNKLTPTMCLLLFLCPEFGIASKQADWMRDVVIRRIPVSDIFADYLSFPIRSDTVSLKVHIPEKHFPKQRYTASEYNTCGGHQRPRRRRRRYYYYDNVNKIKERALFLSIVCGLPRSCLCNDRGHKINV